jgi:hypothetical protein
MAKVSGATPSTKPHIEQEQNKPEVSSAALPKKPHIKQEQKKPDKTRKTCYPSKPYHYPPDEWRG